MSGSQKRLRDARSLAVRFCVFVSNNGINRFEDITSDILRAFLAEMHTTRPASMDDVVSLLKKFFQFLEKNGTIIERHWQLLSSPRSRNHKVKPAMMHEELALILNRVDRKDICGKRDYAVLILAVTTGLRAGDIASLELSDINWKGQEIHLAQGKTGKRLVIPLQHSARDALADYILNGRPQTESRRIFLRNTVPYAPLQDGVSISRIFRKYLKLAGIAHSCNDGKTFHGIRRAVGTYMVSGGVPVTTVSQVLGHQSIRATRQYISLDLQGLRKCALPMSSIGGANE
jgi:site-specific recombinase XerD